MLDETTIGFTVNLLWAMLFGGIIGAERSFRNKAAGFRTMVLICVGTTIFVDVGIFLSIKNATPVIDRVIANIITGIGFLGAGSIFRSSEKSAVEGLTTAASIWYVAGVGILIGLNLHAFAAIATGFALITLLCLGPIERRFMDFLRVASAKAKKIKRPTAR